MNESVIVIKPELPLKNISRDITATAYELNLNDSLDCYHSVFQTLALEPLSSLAAGMPGVSGSMGSLSVDIAISLSA